MCAPIVKHLKILFTKLDFISSICKGSKPCFSDMTMVSSRSWSGSWKRMISGESRRNLICEIGDIVDQSTLAIKQYRKTKYHQLIIESIEKSRSGIENLIYTYSSNSDTVAMLQYHLINLNLLLSSA